MSTIITVKEGALEIIRIKNSPWNTSALPIHAYLIILGGATPTKVEIGNLSFGELADTIIDIPIFLERTGLYSGSDYPCEIIAGKDTDNPVVFCSGDDLIISIESVESLSI
tara:strand:- start:749 stop:1081 length:333 start_codon:yes stop_codon:yes gene_type:complete